MEGMNLLHSIISNPVHRRRPFRLHARLRGLRRLLPSWRCSRQPIGGLASDVLRRGWRSSSQNAGDDRRLPVANWIGNSVRRWVR